MKEDEKVLKKICNSYLKKPISKIHLIKELRKYLPNTIKNKVSAEQPEEIVSDEYINQIKNNSDVYKILQDKKEYIHHISKKMEITEIIDFADELRQVGQKYNYNILINISEKLALFAKGFDIEGVKNIIKKIYALL